MLKLDYKLSKKNFNYDKMQTNQKLEHFALFPIFTNFK